MCVYKCTHILAPMYQQPYHTFTLLSHNNTAVLKPSCPDRGWSVLQGWDQAHKFLIFLAQTEEKQAANIEHIVTGNNYSTTQFSDLHYTKGYARYTDTDNSSWLSQRPGVTNEPQNQTKILPYWLSILLCKPPSICPYNQVHWQLFLDHTRSNLGRHRHQGQHCLW